MHTIYCGLIRDFILYVALITLSIVVGLFLRNIKEIKWKTQSNSGHYLAGKDSGKAYIISQQNDEEKQQQEYLLFNRPIKIEDKGFKDRR